MSWSSNFVSLKKFQFPINSKIFNRRIDLHSSYGFETLQEFINRQYFPTVSLKCFVSKFGSYTLDSSQPLNFDQSTSHNHYSRKSIGSISTRTHHKLLTYLSIKLPMLQSSFHLEPICLNSSSILQWVW